MEMLKQLRQSLQIDETPTRTNSGVSNWEAWVGDDTDADGWVPRTPKLAMENGVYSISDMSSPPLKPVEEMFAPRTDYGAEEFVLHKIGITFCVVGNDVKRVNSVQGTASIAGVQECDEIISANGQDISSPSINGFEAVAICNQAVRDGPTINMSFRDFVTMEIKEIEIDVSAHCPAVKLARERGLESPLITPVKLAYTPQRRTNGDSHYGLGPTEELIENIGQFAPRKRSTNFRFWILSFLAILLLIVLVLLAFAMDDKISEKVVTFADELERTLQEIPLCSCTYSTRGGTYFVPLCRACKPQVIRYGDMSNGAVTLVRKQLCNIAPKVLGGSCQRSTDTVKYLGKFTTYEECEAACIGYNVGKERCRSMTYHYASYPDRKFRYTCYGVTHSGWIKTREQGVASGRLFGPLVQVQRMLVWYVRQLRTKVLAAWFYEGKPWEVGLALVLVIFGLSGIRRTPSNTPTDPDLELD